MKLIHTDSTQSNQSTAYFKWMLMALALVWFDSAQAGPGDTTVVQTLTFDSITTRRATFTFPDGTDSYQKVLMYYTLKCDPATTADGLDCGEWDYLTYSNVYDHTGMMDSTLLTHPNYTVNGSSPATYALSNQANWSLFQKWQYNIVYTDTTSFDSTIVGTGTNTMTTPFESTATDVKTQFLWRESELTGAGLTAGDISGIRLNIDNAGSAANHLSIKIKHTTLDSLTGFSTGGMTTVYQHNTTFTGNGWHYFNFTNAFNWDGSSNLVVEFSFDNSNAGTGTTVLGENLNWSAGASAGGSDNFLSFFGADFVDLPAANYNSITDQVTIAFWQYGDPVLQPQNDYPFEAIDSQNRRQMGSHLPWSNGTIYWDCGNDGSGYDRLQQASLPSVYAGTWTHWAFTKSATGIMNIYLNGNLWATENNKNKDIMDLAKFKIGSSANGGSNYDGFIDEFSVWNVELNAPTIADWYKKDIDNTHPNYSNLLSYHQFNEGTGVIAGDASANSNTGTLGGLPQWMDVKGEDIFRNAQTMQMRPNVVFEQGVFTSFLDSTMVLDSLANPMVSVVIYGDSTTPTVSTDTIYGYPAGYSYTYDANGNVVDSLVVPTDMTFILDEHEYYGEPFEVINTFEIGRFITPYGIGLTLGPDGFTWIYDVTDYVSLLTGSVDLSAGNNQELIDLKFVMIEGTPPRDVIKIDRVWGSRRSYSYANMDNDVNLSSTTIDLDPAASEFKVRTRLTGHGHRSNTGSFPHCCEWKDNTHYLFVDGNQVDDWHIWQTDDCALNPVFPQGGTWPGSREGWCPGDVVKDHEFEITPFVTGSTVTLDYDITDVPTSNLGMGNGNYQTAVHLMQYGAPNHTLDAEVYDIISPNDWEYYSREQRMCLNPRIVIRNSGATDLTSLTVSYSVSGGTVLTHNWTGNLASMQSTEVELPVTDLTFWLGDGDLSFTATVSAPNGGTDEYSFNDAFTTAFDMPDMYKPTFIIDLKTNNIPADNSYTVRDHMGSLVWSRANLTANTTYRDTLVLNDGCYTLELLDTGNDGLSYWAYAAQGNGSISIKDTSGIPIKGFESEFGNRLTHTFSVGVGVGGVDTTNPANWPTYYNDQPTLEQTVMVYPNPNRGDFFLEMSGYTGIFNVEIYNTIGQSVRSEKILVNNTLSKRYDLKTPESGIYFIKLQQDDLVITRKLIISPAPAR